MPAGPQNSALWPVQTALLPVMLQGNDDPTVSVCVPLPAQPLLSTICTVY